MARKSKTVSCDTFTTFLLKQSERLDDEIIRSMHPTDSWIGTVTTRAIIPSWFETLEHVRELSEGLAYKPTQAHDPIDDVWARFDKAFPDLSSAWITDYDKTRRGNACDAR